MVGEVAEVTADRLRRERKARAMLEAGRTTRTIAEEIGVSISTIQKYLRGMLNGEGVKRDPKDRAQEMYDDGIDLNYISRHLGMSKARVSSMISKGGRTFDTYHLHKQTWWPVNRNPRDSWHAPR